MNKPISMVINETKTNLLQICNQSSLHPSILELIIKDVYDEIKYVSSMQLKQDTEVYNKAQEDAKLQAENQETK